MYKFVYVYLFVCVYIFKLDCQDELLHRSLMHTHLNLKSGAQDTHALLNYLPPPSLTNSNQCFGHTQPGCFPGAGNRYGCKHACVWGVWGGGPSRRRNEGGKEAGGKGDVLTMCRAYGSRLLGKS